MDIKDIVKKINEAAGTELSTSEWVRAGAVMIGSYVFLGRIERGLMPKRSLIGNVFSFGFKLWFATKIGDIYVEDADRLNKYMKKRKRKVAAREDDGIRWTEEEDKKEETKGASGQMDIMDWLNEKDKKKEGDHGEK